MKSAIVVAPHPDDETLGCGGTICKLIGKGVNVHYLIITSITREQGYSEEEVVLRNNEIKELENFYGFASVQSLAVPATKVGEIPFDRLVFSCKKVFNEVNPELVFIPYCFDSHTDHYYTSKAVLSCCKWFRQKSIKAVLYYETLSETDFNINPAERAMRPNVYVDVTEYFNQKLQAMHIFQSEMAEFPFPRSDEAISALASLRGAQCGAFKAEAFELVRGTW